MDSVAPGAAPTTADGDAAMVLRVPRSGIDIEEVERRLLLVALAESAGNRSLAARFLGLGRHAFRYRLKKHGLDQDRRVEDNDD